MEKKGGGAWHKPLHYKVRQNSTVMNLRKMHVSTTVEYRMCDQTNDSVGLQYRPSATVK